MNVFSWAGMYNNARKHIAAEETLLFGLFVKKKEIAAEATKNIKNEIDELRQNISKDVEKICSETITAISSSFAERFAVTGVSLRESLSSMGGSLDERLAEVEEQLRQSLRLERRLQMAVESILENQNRTLEMLERQEMSPPLEALMSLAENFALTRLSESDTPESGILYNKLSNLMDCFELGLVSEMGVKFDPEKHEACGARCELDLPDDSVLEVVRPGFLLGGKVLRCATVVVNRHDCPSHSDNQESSL